MKALGMIEVYSFTTVVCCADIMVKTGNVKLIAFDRNRPFAKGFPVPLIMAAKIEGDVADVKAAVSAAKEFAKSRGHYIVSHIIPHPGEDVDKMAFLNDINRDKYNKKLPKNFMNLKECPEFTGNNSIALLEVDGLVASIVGLDAMLKAADVRLVHTEKRLGGRLVTLIVAGKVDAVTSALEHGQNLAAPLGKVYGNEVIANPHPELLKFFDMGEGTVVEK